MDSKTVVTKETKNKIRVDYEGKLSFKERMTSKLKTSNTWIKVGVNILRFIMMLGVSYVILFPFFSKIASSFMTIDDIVDPTVSLIPKNFTLDIYKAVIVENHYVEAFFTTLALSLMCAVLQTFAACLVGYGLAKFKFKGNKLVMALVVFTMVIPHEAMKFALRNHFVEFDILTVITWNYKGPLELIFGHPIDLFDTFWPLAILSATGLAFKNGLYIYLMRQFFKGVPDELEESAYVDGAGTFRTFLQIILPLAVPMMITIFLFSFSWQWTDSFYVKNFFSIGNEAKVYLMGGSVVNIPESIQSIQHAGKSLYGNVVKNTAAMLVISPLVVMYLFCQRYLVQGIERSGLVG